MAGTEEVYAFLFEEEGGLLHLLALRVEEVEASYEALDPFASEELPCSQYYIADPGVGAAGS